MTNETTTPHHLVVTVQWGRSDWHDAMLEAFIDDNVLEPGDSLTREEVANDREVIRMVLEHGPYPVVFDDETPPPGWHICDCSEDCGAWEPDDETTDDE